MTELKSPPTAADLMTTRFETVSPEMSLGDVIQVLIRHHLSSAPVIRQQEGKRKLVGFLSERDCLTAITQESYFGNPAPPQTVATVMKKAPLCVSANTDIFSLASIFSQHGFRQVPVIRDGEIVGIVNRREVLIAVEKYYNDSNWQKLSERFRPDIHELVNHRFIISGD